ncbi:hypothetical protein FHS23_000432 [Prauserella isguenensis]|uniref:DUF2188 domain-containing protein n=1 Tax=Prauserella isguenensis TaxID=1470180 RepID=A0A839RY25_9PSEU|nr:hypothetical protein [Prauserella isguenensis]
MTTLNLQLSNRVAQSEHVRQARHGTAIDPGHGRSATGWAEQDQPKRRCAHGPGSTCAEDRHGHRQGEPDMTVERPAGHAGGRSNADEPARYTAFAVRFRLSPDSLTWLVVRDGTVLSRHVRKRDAERLAAAHARGCRPSSLVVERMDGSEQARRHYRHSRSGARAVPAVVVPRSGENSTLVTRPGSASQVSSGLGVGSPTRALSRSAGRSGRGIIARVTARTNRRSHRPAHASRSCRRGIRMASTRVATSTRVGGSSRTVETR